MVQETQVPLSSLIFPLFTLEGTGIRSEVKSMPGIYRFSPELLEAEVAACVDLGLQAFAVFPSFPDGQKDPLASIAHQDNFYLRTLSRLKDRFPEICIVTDVAMDPYSSDGHDGVYRQGEILNDETLEILAKMSVAQAKAGADVLGPSDMMDGRVGYIRQALDAEGFTDVSIMSYTAKYASAFYGPFRDALDSAPKSGDKKTYQMDPANSDEALLEAQLDVEEGADFLMVKPALAYLDIIARLAENFPVPIAAYNVSGEYAMLKAAAQNGWLDAVKCRNEMLMSIRRAGAKVILSYFAKEYAEDLAK